MTNTPDDFRPTRILIRPEPSPVSTGQAGGASKMLLVAEDERTGQFVGIAIPANAAEAALAMLPTTGTRFLTFWQSYEESRGGTTFFEDLLRLVTALTSPTAPADLRRLARAPTAEDFMHNAYQAHAMVAVNGWPGASAGLIRSTATSRTADFLVIAPDGAEIPVEVKAVLRVTGIEVQDEGWRLIEQERRAIIRSIRQEIDDAVSQCGPQGAVLVAIWCDIAGARILEAFGERECTLAEALLSPGTVVIGLRDDTGADRWLRQPLGATDWLDELDKRLSAHSAGPLTIPVNTGSIAMLISNRTEWASMGRIFKLADFSTRLTLQVEDLERLRKRRLLEAISSEALMLWWARWETVAPHIERFWLAYPKAAVTLTTPTEWFAHPVWAPLSVWMGCLSSVLESILGTPEAPHAGFEIGEIQRDYSRCRTLLQEAGRRFWNAPDARWGIQTVLNASVGSLEFRIVCRLSNTVESMLRHELEARDLLAPGSAPTMERVDSAW